MYGIFTYIYIVDFYRYSINVGKSYGSYGIAFFCRFRDDDQRIRLFGGADVEPFLSSCCERTKLSKDFCLFTLPKFNMEPKKDGFQKEGPIPGCHFQVPC